MPCRADVDGLTCDERIDKSSNTIESVFEENLACQNDEDCTHVEVKTDCEGACSAAVAKTGVRVVQEAVRQANEDDCENFETDGCAFKTMKCSAAFVPTCGMNNRCVMAVP